MPCAASFRARARLFDRALEERAAHDVQLPALPAPATRDEGFAAQGQWRSSFRHGYDIDTHFKPQYNPWDQRLCLVPDGDLFRAISDGSASVVTDSIDAFTERGIRLTSGAELEADLIVTATGLNMLAFGGIELAVDGRVIELPETMSYKGMMLSGVPNFAFTLGYTNASWTLKCDLTCEYLCRLLNHMREHGYSECIPHRDPTVAEQPIIDFSSGYIQRSIDQFPRQGSEPPVAPASKLCAGHPQPPATARSRTTRCSSRVAPRRSLPQSASPSSFSTASIGVLTLSTLAISGWFGAIQGGSGKREVAVATIAAASAVT